MTTTDGTNLTPETHEAPRTPTDALGAEVTPEERGPSFAEMGLRPEVLRALEEMGFTHPMRVQAATLPLLSEGRDVMVQSRTGSGKTAAFGIPFAQSLVDPDQKYVQALVLLPTRELALQVAAELAKICTHRRVSVVPVYGGAPMGRQVELIRAGSQIVCGTPGRILDHLRRGTLKLDKVRCAVLDECDEMLSMGFQEDIEAILERTPEARQTLLFSATVPEGIQRLARRFMRSPEFLKLSGDFVGVHEIKHVYYAIPGVNRESELLRVIAFEEPKTAIIFCNTREETGRVAEYLRQHGHQAEAISSDLSQSDRERVMGRMRAGKIQFLVATDVAARGIDIENLSHVFNYTFPESPESYIHRTGRTGRAGKHGTAISLIGPTEVGSFYYLKLLYKIRPEERALPSEAEIRSHREGERLQALRASVSTEPGSEWRSLARRVMSAIDGEKLIAALLAESLSEEPGPAVTPVRSVLDEEAADLGAEPRRAEPAAVRAQERARFQEPRRDRERAEERPRGERRPDDGERDAGARAPRPEGGEERPTRAARFSERRGERGERDRDRGRSDRPRRSERVREGSAEPPREAATEPAREVPEEAPRRAVFQPRERREEAPRREVPDPRPASDREFWDVWSDSAPSDAALPSTTTPARLEATEPAPSARSAGAARLYLNLGRKDGAGEAEIRDLIDRYANVTNLVSIEVMNTHTYLDVEPADADRVCAGLTGQEIGTREIVCEPAKPRRR